jgi:cytoskeleton protein RodZ
MEKEDLGTLLREARERRQMSLTEIARRTKVPQSSLEILESGHLDGLPADVFVRGFIRSYARFVGISDVEPLGLYQRALDDRRRAEQASIVLPKPVERPEGEEDGQPPRRGIGLAVFVIIVLLIATITWSLFLRQPPQSGEGLSLLDVPAVPAEGPAAARERLLV